MVARPVTIQAVAEPAMPFRATCPKLVLLLPLLALAGCSVMPGPAGDPADTSVVIGAESPEASAAPTLSNNPAVLALLDTAHSNASAGQLPAATASIERALRIEPRNPVLWQELARIKLEAGEYQQAENFAARSNSWAGANRPLQAQNWHIISEARALRGDNTGAKAALARAQALEAEQ